MAIVNDSNAIVITPDYLVSIMNANPLRIPLINISGTHYKYYIVSILPQAGVGTHYMVTVDYGRIGRNPQHIEHMVRCDLRTAANEAYALFRKKVTKGYSRINSDRFNFIPLADRGMVTELNSVSRPQSQIKTMPLRAKKKLTKEEKKAELNNRFNSLII